jgi:hypothetical protein
MAFGTTKKKVLYKLQADVKELKKAEKATKDFQGATGKLKKQGKSMTASFLKAQVAMEAFKVAVRVAGKAVQATARFMAGASKQAAEQERALKSLGVFYENVLHKDAREAQEVAKELAAELNIGVGASAEALQRLFKSGLNIDQASELLRRFTNEAITGKTSSLSLSDAVENLAQMYQTEMSTLGDRAGISENMSVLLRDQAEAEGLVLSQLEEGQREQLKYRAFIELTNQTLGSSEKILETLSGQQTVFNTRWNQITATIGGAVNPALKTLYQELLIPALDTIKEWLPNVEMFASRLSTDTVSAIFSFAESVRSMYKTVLNSPFLVWLKEQIDVLEPRIKAFIGGFIGGFTDVWNTVVKEVWEKQLKPAFKELQEQLGVLFGSDTENSIESTGEVIGQIASVVVVGLQGVVLVITKVMTWYTKLTNLIRQSRVFINNQIDKQRNRFQLLKETVKDVWDSIRSIASGGWSFMVDTIKDSFNAVINQFNKGIGKINDAVDKLREKKALKGVVPDINIEPIQTLAKGTSFFNGGMAIVGEEGPELVTMPRGSRVTPADETAQMVRERNVNVVNNFYNTEIDPNALSDRLIFQMNTL